MTIAFAAALAAACASTGTSTTNVADVRPSIDRVNAQMVAAMNSGRVDDVLPLYAPDAIVLAPNAPPMAGHGAIRQFWGAVSGMKMSGVSLTTDQVEVHGDVAIETGSYTMTLTPPGASSPVNDRGKYLVVWKRQSDGSWKIYRDMFSTNLGQ
jgi:uncharacterized protein (TIGR02246 family)